jgi:hypothetical protein
LAKKKKGLTPEEENQIYPYSLGPKAEYVFLSELRKVLDILLWRADEIESCMAEQRLTGAVTDQLMERGRWCKTISGETRLFGAIEAFLAAWARMSLLLYPIKERDQPRGQHLRFVLGIREVGPTAPLNDRKLRDGWMHLDEDLGKLCSTREGDIAASAVATENEEWYHLARRGSVSVIDPKKVAIALTLRGAWLLKPYFHRCKELRNQVRFQISNEYRWINVNGISGIAVGWSGRPERYMMKALGTKADITVESDTYSGVIAAFEQAVARWQSSTSTR